MVGTGSSDGGPAGGGAWALVRNFRLKPGADRAALVAMTEETYGPLLRQQAGFVSYHVLRPEDDAWTSVTVWRDEAAADAGVAALRPWIEANVLPFVHGEPEGSAGAVEVAVFADHD